MILPVKLLYLLLISMAYSKEYCPKLCICDIFEGFKRADCSDQHLINTCTNVPNSVEILNLSGNEITIIDNECLKNYINLINLSFARNSIHTIEFFSFDTFAQLDYLDLSDNRLEEIDNRLFENNLNLKTVDMSKNKFMSLKDQPFIISKSIEILSLRSSNVAHIYSSMFSQLPNLKELDVSNNLLIQISTNSFENMFSLEFINLEYNRFSCDREMENILQWFRKHVVTVKIDKCVKNAKKPMFERMIEDPTVTEPPREDIDIDLVWGDYVINISRSDRDPYQWNVSLSDYYNEILKAEQIYELCEGEMIDYLPENITNLCDIRTCHDNFITLFKRNELTNLRSKNMELTIATVFYVALGVGVIAGIIFMYGFFLLRKKLCVKNQNKQARKEPAGRFTHARLVESQNQSPAITNRSTPRNTDVQSTRETTSSSPMNRNNLNVQNTERITTAEVVRNNLAQRPVPAQRILNRTEYVNNLDIQHQRQQLLQQQQQEQELQRQQQRRQQNQQGTYDQLYHEHLQRHLLENPAEDNIQIPVNQQSGRVYQYTPTAILLQNLFRRRQPRYMYSQQGGNIRNPEMESLTTATTVDVNSSPAQSQSSRDNNESSSQEINHEDVFSEINLLRNEQNHQRDDDESSEYLSISNLSLDMGPERCETPPPAYKSLYTSNEKM